MKKLILPAAALLAISWLSSCQKTNEHSAGRQDSPVELTVDLTGISTSSSKVAGQTEAVEATIRSVQVFVFNSSTGQIDNAVYKGGLSASGNYTMDPLKCTVGEKEIWAVVNAPANYVSSGAVRTAGDLKSIKVKLADNGSSALLMAGSATRTLAATTETVSISVARLCAAVVLKEVQNEFSIPAYADKFNIRGAYLMNAPAVQRLDGSIPADSEDSVWSAFYGKAVSPEAVDLLVESIGDENIPIHGSHSRTHSFYTFANCYDGAEGNDASPHVKCSTYLIVECAVDGVPCIYPIVLPELEANNKYNVSLKVNHAGGDPEYPWRKVDFSSFSSGITVEPWTDVQISETI